MRANLTAKRRIIPVSAPLLVIIGLVALSSRVLYLALTRAVRGCARGRGNSSSVVTSGWSGPRGLANILQLPQLLLLSRGQLVKLGFGVMPVNNVSLLVYFSLENLSLVCGPCPRSLCG
jgi:hypothetical protein